MKTLVVETREQWRQWLAEHHATTPEVWLVFHKRHTGRATLGYDAAVEEALCFGWIDSLVKRLDDECYARKFTPRKADSRWSTLNRNRYAKLQAAGKLMPPGLQRAPTNRSGDAARPSASEAPDYIARSLKADAAAWNFFQRLAPSYRQSCIAWIDSARKPETRRRRLEEVKTLFAAGKKLGLK